MSDTYATSQPPPLETRGGYDDEGTNALAIANAQRRLIEENRARIEYVDPLKCPEPECAERVPFETLTALNLHARRNHNPEAEAKRVAATVATFDELRQIRQARLSESPEVQRIIAESNDKSGHPAEFEARRKRKQRARNLSAADFERSETQRARDLAAEFAARDETERNAEDLPEWANESPAVLKELRIRYGSKSDRGTFRHRRADAFKRGETLEEFERTEIARARTIASGQKWTGTLAAQRRRQALAGVMPPMPDGGAVAVAEQSTAVVHRETAEHDRANDLFARVGRATDELFPDRVPSDRIIEVAEWQVGTLRMLQR